MGEESEVLIRIGGILDVTGEVVAMWVIVAVIALLSFLAARKMKERPGVFQNMVETGVEYLDNFFSGIIGKHLARKYYFFLGSLFIFILFANYSGILPGVGLTKYLRAPTSSLSVTLGLGVFTFVFLQIAGLKAGVKHYFKRFVSPIAFMLPLMVLDEFIKPASLALRLFGNLYGEEAVTENLYNIFPIAAPLIMQVLSLLFCLLQAIVFTMLLSIYISEGLEEE